MAGYVLVNFLPYTNEFQWQTWINSQYLGINHICFAEDQFIVCYPNEPSFQVVHNALLEFYKFSSLQPNKSKSKLIIAGVLDQES